MAHRFPMHIDKLMAPVLFPFGGLQSGSFAEITEDNVRFRFGVLFDNTFLRSEVAGASKREMHWWNGIGWRSNLAGRIGLLGSHDGVVEVRFKKRSRAFVVFPCDSVAISLEDPGGFLAALKAPE